MHVCDSRGFVLRLGKKEKHFPTAPTWWMLVGKCTNAFVVSNVGILERDALFQSGSLE